MASPQLAKAVLIPMDGDQPSSDESQYLLVQFNPASLSVGLSNTVKAENNGGGSATSAQFIEKSESTLSVELLFDTSVPHEASQQVRTGGEAGGAGEGGAEASARHEANSDVRQLTQAIADRFMKPTEGESDNPQAPTRCRFQWGAFAFVGMISSYDETLEFFSPEGIPLRARLSLTLKEGDYQFERLNAEAAKRDQPGFTPGGEGTGAGDANRSQGRDPRDWRDTALFNGLENPRQSPTSGLLVPQGGMGRVTGSGGRSASAGVRAGFSGGASASLGTDIPGAFGSSLRAGASAKTGGGLSAVTDLNATGRGPLGGRGSQ